MPCFIVRPVNMHIIPKRESSDLSCGLEFDEAVGLKRPNLHDLRSQLFLSVQLLAEGAPPEAVFTVAPPPAGPSGRDGGMVAPIEQRDMSSGRRSALHHPLSRIGPMTGGLGRLRRLVVRVPRLTALEDGVEDHH